MAASTFSLAFSTLLVAFSRIYLGVHTREQVLVGAVLGLVLGPIWFRLTRDVFLNSKKFHKAFDSVFDGFHKLFCTKRKTKR